MLIHACLPNFPTCKKTLLQTSIKKVKRPKKESLHVLTRGKKTLAIHKFHYPLSCSVTRTKKIHFLSYSSRIHGSKLLGSQFPYPVLPLLLDIITVPSMAFSAGVNTRSTYSYCTDTNPVYLYSVATHCLPKAFRSRSIKHFVMGHLKTSTSWYAIPLSLLSSYTHSTSFPISSKLACSLFRRKQRLARLVLFDVSPVQGISPSFLFLLFSRLSSYVSLITSTCPMDVDRAEMYDVKISQNIAPNHSL